MSIFLKLFQTIETDESSKFIWQGSVIIPASTKNTTRKIITGDYPRTEVKNPQQTIIKQFKNMISADHIPVI